MISYLIWGGTTTFQNVIQNSIISDLLHNTVTINYCNSNPETAVLAPTI